MATQTKQASGRCPDGQPHHWQLGDPAYEWQGAQYVEITQQHCLRCPAERENVCPIPADVWTVGQGVLTWRYGR